MRIPLAIAILLTLAAPAIGQPGEAPYASPMKEKCNEELKKDDRWYNDLKQLFVNQLFFDPRTGEVANPPAELPEPEPGYESPMRQQCTAEMKKDPKWMAELRAHYDGVLSFEFQDRNARAAVKNEKHVFGAYAAFLLLLVALFVVLFMRQRKLVAEIDQLRHDVERAARE